MCASLNFQNVFLLFLIHTHTFSSPSTFTSSLIPNPIPRHVWILRLCACAAIISWGDSVRHGSAVLAMCECGKELKLGTRWHNRQTIVKMVYRKSGIFLANLKRVVNGSWLTTLAKKLNVSPKGLNNHIWMIMTPSWNILVIKDVLCH